MPVIQSESESEVHTHTRFGPPKKSVGTEVMLVAGVVQTSDPRQPALEALPNLSLSVSETCCALRALNEAVLRATIWIALHLTW